MISLIIADDHPILREGLKSIIENDPNCNLVGEAGDGAEVTKMVVDLKPDLVIMDIMMPRMDGIIATEYIKRYSPNTKVIILSMYKEKEYVLRAFRAGAHGYVLKDLVTDELMDAIHRVLEGKRYACSLVTDYLIDEYVEASREESEDPFDSLSLREREVLRLIVEGQTNNDIAKNLCISLSTVKTHRRSIMKLLGVHDVATLTRMTMEKGFFRSA